MPWVVTLHVTACSGGANLGGAFITDGQSTGYTDSYGDFTAVIYDDVDPAYGVNVGKAGYTTRYTVLYQTQAGSTVQVCLDAAPPPSSGGGGTTGCFIVSATTGSPHSVENMRLNMLRDRLLRTTDIGAALLDAIYSDYYSFSPPIAAELTADPKLREQVLRVAVRPLLAWYGLIEVLALDKDKPAAIDGAAQAVLDACDNGLPQSAEHTAALLDRIRRCEPLPEDAPSPFAYLGSRLGESVSLPFSAWAIFEPLSLIWGCAATGSDVVESARFWLAQAPLDELPSPSSSERLDAELAQLANGPFASAGIREQVGARLLSVWPHLEEDLRKHGFVGEGLVAAK